MHARSPSRRLSESPSHSFLETVSSRSGYHLVLSENNVRIHAQLQPVTCLAVLVEENLVSRNTRRLEGVMANLDILSGHKMDPSGKMSREIPHVELRDFRGRGSMNVLQTGVSLTCGRTIVSAFQERCLECLWRPG